KAAVSREETSSRAAWCTGRFEVAVTQALPTAESVDSVKRTTTATRARSMRPAPCPPMSAHLRDPDRSGPDDDDEEDREDADQDREDDLHGNLLCLLLRPLTSPH